MARGQPKPEPQARRSALAASGRRIDLRKGGKGYRHKAKPEEWQAECWRYFDVVGEVKQAMYLVANTISLVRLFIAHQPDPEQDPVPADPGMPGLDVANQTLERLRTGAHGGHGGMLRDMALNLKVPGECYLVGWPERPAGPATSANPEGTPAEPERWQVCSISELTAKGDEYVVHENRGDPGTPLPRPDNTGAGGAVLVRVWVRHPEFSNQADSALSGVLTECREVFAIQQAAIAAWNSRTSAPVFLVPSELDLDEMRTDDDGNETLTPFEDRLMEMMVTPIQNPGDASSVVPPVLRGISEHLDKIRTVDLSRPIDERASDRQQALIRRIGNSLDVPVEGVTGHTDVKAWALAWQVDQATWARYGDPTTRLILEGVTSGLLRPMLEEAQVDPADAAQLMIWFDPGDAIADPDMSQSADEALDRGAIGWSAYRTAKKFSEDDAPTPEERTEIADFLGARRAALPPANGSTPGPTPPTPGPTPPAPNSASSNGHGRVPLAAAARDRRPIGERLAEIDRLLRARLLEAAEAAMARALERAGVRLRNRAKRDQAVSASLGGVTNARVAARLGASVVAALGATEDELLDDAFAEFATTFDSRTARAQRRTRAALADEFDLDDAELADLEGRQEEDRHHAGLWLTTALVSLAGQRLFNPDPAAPPFGEHTPGMTVPPGLIREAMARAGGSPGQPAQGPPGGVALGDLVLDTFARHGQIIDGWEWTHGEPDRPFPAHEALDGQQFASFDDDVLVVAGEDDWLGVDHYRPGDHEGCQCSFIPVAIERSEAEPALVATVGARR